MKGSVLTAVKQGLALLHLEGQPSSDVKGFQGHHRKGQFAKVMKEIFTHPPCLRREHLTSIARAQP